MVAVIKQQVLDVIKISKYWSNHTLGSSRFKIPLEVQVVTSGFTHDNYINIR